MNLYGHHWMSSSGMISRRLSSFRSSSSVALARRRRGGRYDTTNNNNDARSSRRWLLDPSPPPSTQHPQQRWHGGGGGGPTLSGPTVQVTFQLADGATNRTVTAQVGESLLQVAHRHEIELEGACEGVCACSTCHLILPHTIYDTLPEPSEDEEDMLDMAFGLTETSRLGCQVLVTTDMDGIVLELPKATRNFYVDGHKPKPH